MALVLATACSGIGAPEVAARQLGWRTAWCAEIATFPSKVLAERHPSSVNLGDLEALSRGKTPIPAGRIDVLAAGTPCVSFSVAGLRKGLADPRGNLALAFLELVGRVRPAWVLWENVPGVLSSNRGRDFGAFLGGLGELGYGWAYRVLDAQYFGVPQRRRRVFVVGHLGGWAGAAAVLLEPESMRGDPPPRRASREAVAGPLGAGAPGSGWRDDLDRAGAFIPETAHAVRQREGSRQDVNGETYLAHALRAAGHDASEDGAGRANLIPIQCVNRASGRAQNGMGIGKPGDPMYTLDRRSDHAVGRVAVALHLTQDPISGDVSPALGASTGGMGVAAAGVRRLTPEECERLQAFPTGYTAVPVARVPRSRLTSPRAAEAYIERDGEVWRLASDAARYEALGNSMAVCVVRWVFARIERVHVAIGADAEAVA